MPPKKPYAPTKGSKLLGAYMSPSEIERFDNLIEKLYSAGYILNPDRSDLLRFAIDFFCTYFEAVDLDRMRVVYRLMYSEGVIDPSIASFAAFASRYLSNKVIDNVPMIIGGSSGANFT